MRSVAAKELPFTLQTHLTHEMHISRSCDRVRKRHFKAHPAHEENVKISDAYLFQRTCLCVHFPPLFQSERLELDHIYGFRCHDTLNNLGGAKGGEIVYYAAKVAVSEQIHRSGGKRQKIFTGHEREISCIIAHPTEAIAATGEEGNCPSIHIWSTAAHKAVQGGANRPGEGAECSIVTTLSAGVACMSFCDSFLVVVGKDSSNTLQVYDWRKRHLMASCPAEEEPAQPILSVCCLLQGKRNLSVTTVGSKHVLFWQLLDGTKLVGKRGRFLSLPGKWQTFTCTCFIKVAIKASVSETVILTGAEDGSIYAWSKEGRLMSIVPDVHAGGVSCLSSFDGRPLVVSGGADGLVRVWEIRGFDDGHGNAKAGLLRGSSQQSISLHESSENQEFVVSLAIVSLPGEEKKRVAAGTSKGTIYVMEIDHEGKLATPSPAVRGHIGSEEHVTVGVCQGAGGLLAASASKDGFVYVWDLELKSLLHSWIVKGGIVCMDWCGTEGPLADHMIICLENGRLQTHQVSQGKQEQGPVLAVRGSAVGTCARFSKEGISVAVGRDDGNCPNHPFSMARRLALVLSASVRKDHKKFLTLGESSCQRLDSLGLLATSSKQRD